MDRCMNMSMNGCVGGWIHRLYEINVTWIHLNSEDLIAFPNKGGGMENWGLITYGEDYLVYQSETAPASRKQLSGKFQSHELAHMVTTYNALLHKTGNPRPSGQTIMTLVSAFYFE